MGTSVAVKCASLFWRVRPVSRAGSFLDGPFDQDLFDLPHPGRVPLGGVALDDLEEAGHPPGGHVLGDEAPLPSGGLGAGAGREDERVGGVIAGLFGHLEGALEVFVGLAREADDDVGGHGQVGDGRAGGGQPVEVALGRVAPVHPGQRPVAAGLQRQVRCSQTGLAPGHGLDRLGAVGPSDGAT